MGNTTTKEINSILDVISISDTVKDLEAFETSVNNLFKEDKFKTYTKFEIAVVEEEFKKKYKKLNN